MAKSQNIDKHQTLARKDGERQDLSSFNWPQVLHLFLDSPLCTVSLPLCPYATSTLSWLLQLLYQNWRCYVPQPSLFLRLTPDILRSFAFPFKIPSQFANLFPNIRWDFTWDCLVSVGFGRSDVFNSVVFYKLFSLSIHLSPLHSEHCFVVFRVQVLRMSSDVPLNSLFLMLSKMAF